MNKAMQLMTQIVTVLPMLMRMVEMFMGAGNGQRKKEVVKVAVKDMVTDDPAFDGMIDAAIEAAHRKAVHAGGDLADVEAGLFSSKD